jgi:CxxC motif-containing protein (DUF1111 family)
MRVSVRFCGTVSIVAVLASLDVALTVRSDDLAGKDLFTRRWVSHDQRSSGDGLGPMHNATSCAACHEQGGLGGAGGQQHNVDLLSVLLPDRKFSAGEQTAFAANLTKLHAGFGSNPGTVRQSIVLHRFGPEGDYRSLRARLLGLEETTLSDDPAQRAVAAITAAKRRGKQSPFSENITHGNVLLRRTQRNTPALWGAGLIDTIPAPAIEEFATRQEKSHPAISGRVARTAAGQMGRFGWRGQIETLRDFVLAACANELGLQTNGHSQAVNPLAAHYKPEGIDLSSADVDALVAFVANLPKPSIRQPRNSFEEESLRTGTRVFERIGCSTCHVRQLGTVDGLFSDLLLHDMGEALEDPAEALPAQRPNQHVGMGSMQAGWVGGPSDLFDQKSHTPELAREWRTPPLWGVADSAPYMHDGRAETLAEAILLHGGEAAAAIEQYRNLANEERASLFFFLKSLVAPKPRG